jgi:hypothetical protein
MIDSERDLRLTEREAYDAMVAFLARYHRETQYDEVGLLLSEFDDNAGSRSVVRLAKRRG